MNKETVVGAFLKPSSGRRNKTNPQHLIYHSRTYRRGKEWTMTLMVIKTLERVSKNYYYIIRGENIGEEEKEFISIIAILHDIGAVEAQKKYGSIDGVYQEKEGPEVAKEILKKVGYNKNIDRICFIIGNHHTPSKIDGLDFQIQWEADLLENLTVMDKEKEQEKFPL